MICSNELERCAWSQAEKREEERQGKKEDFGFKSGLAHLLFYCFANFYLLIYILISKGLRQGSMILSNPRCQSFTLSDATCS